jgi:hypothetical protein
MRKLIIALLLFPGLLYSQTVPLNEVDFYLELINTIDNYEKYSSLRKKSFYNKYDNLFTSEAKVLDDIVPSSTFGEYLKFDEYSMNIRRLKRKRLSTDIKILEISDKKESSDANSGTIDVHVIINRDMAFESKEGNIFYKDKIEYVDWPQTTNCIITLKYDIYEEKNGDNMQEGVNWKIESIKSTKTINKLNIYIPFTKTFLLPPKLLVGTGVMLDGQEVKFQGEKLAYFIKDKIDKKKNEMSIIGKETEYTFTKVKPLDNSLFVNQVIFSEKVPLYGNLNIDQGVNYGFTNSNSILSMGTHSYSDENSGSLTAYLFKPTFLSSKEVWGSKIRTQIGVNVLYSNSNLSITDAEFTSVEENSIDIDGHSYTRTNHIYNITEDININATLLNFSARLDIDKSVKIKGKFNSIQFGVFTNVLLLPIQNTATSTISAVGNYSGEYEQFDNLIIGDDEQFERYDLGTYDLSSSKDLQIEYAPVSMFEVGIVGDYIFPKGWGFNVGFSSIVSNAPLTSSSLQELSNGSDNINSMLDLVDEFNIHSKIKLKLGLIYKL